MVPTRGTQRVPRCPVYAMWPLEDADEGLREVDRKTVKVGATWDARAGAGPFARTRGKRQVPRCPATLARCAVSRGARG